MKVLVIGYGRMGHMVEELARAEGTEIAGCVDVDTSRSDWPSADVAIDFTSADAVAGNVARLAERHTNVVIGTTGWGAQEADVRRVVDAAGIGVVASANFSVGVNLFQMLVAEAAGLLTARAEYGSWIHELHHITKRDAPSGTALLLRDAMTGAGFNRPIDMSSSRAGAIPGTHTVGFDGPSDTIELTHTARDRRGFASGALLAARWVMGRRGWFSMVDVLRG